MLNRYLRPLLIVEFLIAIEAIFTVWSEVGGQYHLDLMFWPWKLGIGVLSAWLVVAITANLVHHDGQFTRRALLFCSFLLAIFVVAGVVTYYYHVNEPPDQDDDQEDAPARISRVVEGQATKNDRLPHRSDQVAERLVQSAEGVQVQAGLPGAAGVSIAHHR